jgi:hypothetical protein
MTHFLAPPSAFESNRVGLVIFIELKSIIKLDWQN